MKIYRAWINQPSTLQPLHHLHGRACIAVDAGLKDNITLYFTEGDVHSMIAPRLSVSDCGHIYQEESSMTNKQETANRITELLLTTSRTDKWWILAQMLECHADWNRTPQGNNYWQTVRDHMMNLSKGADIGRRVCLKEPFEFGHTTLRVGSMGYIRRIDPIRVEIDGLVNLLFAIPEDKLSLR